MKKSASAPKAAQETLTPKQAHARIAATTEAPALTAEEANAKYPEPILSQMLDRLVAVRRGMDDLLEGLGVNGTEAQDGEDLVRARIIMKHVRQLELDVSELGGPGVCP